MQKVQYCHCGKPLHYDNQKERIAVEGYVKRFGEFVCCADMQTGRRFKVPRHYIALHGLQGKDLATLGFLELKRKG
jgi:hypothetical protein